MSIKSKNIKFVGLLNNKAYHNYLSKCAATINVSSKEDFGMAALEGMAYGKPGTQSRKFTHVSDTVKVCVEAWKKNNENKPKRK